MKRPTTVEQPIPTYGVHLLSALEAPLFEDAVVLCAPEAWEMVREQFPGTPRAVVVPTSMDHITIVRQLDELPRARAAFGIGGGSACDAAKLYAWRTGARLVLVPTVLSVDAPFTKAIAVRVSGRVRYVGKVVADYLLIDFDLLARSPVRLNRAGVGDVLSIYTALHDWRLAAAHRAEPYDEEIAREAEALLERLFDGAETIRACGEDGLRLIAELYVGEVELCERFGNSRPEEGSEHYLAYCLEALTGKHYLHGELVAFAVLLTALAQGQSTERVLDFCRRTGVECRASAVGIQRHELRAALLRLPGYLAEEAQLPYGVYHPGVSEAQADRWIDGLAEMDLL